MTTYTWTDNAMRSGTTCDVDKVADNLMHLKYDTSGGVCKFNNLGTISSNFTLTANYITTGDVAGNYTLTLPTVTDTEKQIVCVFDFSTTSASYPAITNTNLKWNKNNNGQAPSAYSTTSGVRNILTFKSVWISGTLYWEAEYTTFGITETTFVQPALSSNGTLGGTTFAVSASDQVSGPAWQAFDGVYSTVWQTNNYVSSATLIIYNPTALKCKNIYFTNKDDAPTGVTIYGSNDNSIYYTLTTLNSPNTADGAIWAAPISTENQNFYKYYKIYIPNSTNGINVGIRQITLDATYLAS